MLTAGIITKVLVRTVTNNKEIFTRLIIGVLIYSTILSYQTYNTSIQDTPILGGLFHTNNLINGIEMYIFILSVLLISFLIGRDDLVAEYRIILGFSILGMITLIESYDLISTFLAIELQSLSLYVIATISRKEATAAGLKYFLLGSLSSAIFLLGLVLIYSLTGITQYDGFNILYAPINELTTSNIIGDEEYKNFVLGGIILITIGLLFKIGAAPFHNWAPDVYDNVPTIVTSWLAIMGKISILSFLFVLKSTGVFAESLESFTLITLSATLSLIIGSILGLVQYRIKRLLAYSSISHLGFLLIGLAIDNGLAVSSFLFYMFQYWLSLISIFAILIESETHQKSSLQSISSLRFLKFNPALIFALIISLFSLTGIPPLIGFFGKQMILYTSLLNGYYFISTIAICTSVISAAYYLRIVKTISFTLEDNNSKDPRESLDSLTSSRPLSWIISIITLITLLFFINTSVLLNFTHGFAVWNLLS
uniref:NADH-ubiquinone oxidoreductase chain 2 n=1 Tax=Blastocladiella emersonii TaxID=4808 RepID=B6A7S6_BLAEM|nr:NADH dehydrogenase subunit 2 [Blastocladiella emersonii]ABB78017.1 NADH dehydrogenase subunit 2 [Blastocladiella emersonii]